MKHILALLFVCTLFTAGEVVAQHGVDYIVTSDLGSGVKTPSEVYELVGRQRSQKPTWAVVEMNGEPTGVNGQLRKITQGKNASTYVVGTDTIGLPNKDYRMNKDTLYNSRSQKLECIIIELKECECGPKTGILFGEDSVTTNSFPAHKMVLDSASAEWRQEGSFFVPGVSAEEVNTLDPSETSAYGLAITTTDGAVCEIFWLRAEERIAETKVQLYEVSLREGRRFAQTDAGYTLDGKLIQSMKVVKPHNPIKKVSGAKKGKHKKRTKI